MWACFLYQNLFKGLKKTRNETVREFNKDLMSQEDMFLGVRNVQCLLNAGVGVVHAVCERPWVQLSVLSMFIVLLCYHNYK